LFLLLLGQRDLLDWHPQQFFPIVAIGDQAFQRISHRPLRLPQEPFSRKLNVELPGAAVVGQFFSSFTEKMPADHDPQKNQCENGQPTHPCFSNRHACCSQNYAASLGVQITYTPYCRHSLVFLPRVVRLQPAASGQAPFSGFRHRDGFTFRLLPINHALGLPRPAVAATAQIRFFWSARTYRRLACLVTMESDFQPPGLLSRRGTTFVWTGRELSP